MTLNSVKRWVILINYFAAVFELFSTDIDLQYNPSHLEMDAVAYAMGSQWRVVAQLIMPVLSEFEIQKIESEEQENQPLCFLQAWINKHGLKATRAALCSALFFADLGSGAREVFPEIYENMSKVFNF